jgi:hypothetical protein
VPARVYINDQSVASFLSSDPEAQKHLEQAASALIGQAIANSPVGKTRTRLPMRGARKNSPRARARKFLPSSGYFKRHFELRRFRGGWRVWNTDPFAHLVEWGSVNNVAYAPIRRAIRTSGLRYVPNPESRGA